MKYNQELPKEVEERLDAYIQGIKAIKWLKPSKDLKKEDVDKMVNASLQAFGVEAGIEYRRLETKADLDAARDAPWDAGYYAACDAAQDAAYDADWDAARDAARDTAWGATRYAVWSDAEDAARKANYDVARNAACGAVETLVCELPEYKGKKAFLSLIPLYEAGLYPVGVIGGKFVVYVPTDKEEFTC